MQPQPAPAPALAAVSDGLARTVEGRIVNAGPIRRETAQDVEEGNSALQTQRLDLDVSSVEVVSDEQDLQKAMQGRVRLTVRWPEGGAKANGFDCGERVQADARLMQPSVYRDPGVWSRRDYLLDQGISATASVDADRVRVMAAAKEPTAACRIAGWQQRASAGILALPAAMNSFPASLRLNEANAIMLAAMVTGDRTYLTHSLRVGFERTGSFHMLVVSGLHLAIVAGLIFWIAKKVRLPRLPATLVTIAASFAYALFTGFAIPGAAFALDGDAVSCGPAGLPRAERAEHHWICIALFAGGKPEESV